MGKVNNNAKELVSLALSATTGNYGAKTMAGNASSGTSFQKFLSGANDKKSSGDIGLKSDNKSAKDKVMNGDRKKTDNVSKKDKSDDVKPQDKDEKTTEKKKAVFSKEDTQKADAFLDLNIAENVVEGNTDEANIQEMAALMMQDTSPLNAKEVEITKKIAEVTGLSEEEVTSILEDMGVGALQLADKDVLTDFMQKAYDVETPIDLLNVDGAKEIMTAVTETAQQAVDELNLNEPDFVNMVFEAKVAEKADNRAAERFDRMIGNDLPKAEFMPEGELVQFAAINGAAQGDGAMFSQNGNAFSGNSQFNFGNDQNTDMAAATVVNDNLNEAINNAVLRKEEPAARADSAEIIRQIIERIEIRASETRASEMRITLKPDYLGEVSLRIASQNGIVTAQFTAESQRVKEIIEANFEILRDALASQGIEIGQLEVNVGNSNENSGMFAGNGYYGGNTGSTGVSSDTQETESAENVSGYVGEENEVVEANVSYRV